MHPDLVRVAERAIAISRQDFIVTEGVRTKERQKELYAQGRTKPGQKVTWTLTSNHFVKADGFGHAIDVVPHPVDWSDAKKFHAIAQAMKAAAKELNVSLGWGGDWTKNRDLPHFELTK
ncbi:M15 family metallopeptidase [Brevundimonas bullata]|uniref:M15 family metallopeptidase n=1 Tax=Brevundimonas bullata TaxID=13160 RepID=UPI002FDB5CCF